MGNVLSQDEVDSLLTGIDEGKVETESDISKGGDSLDVYDFSSQTGPSHLRMSGLKVVNERLLSFLKPSISAVTGCSADINLESTDSVKFGEFCDALSLPASLNIFKMEPLRGLGLIILDDALVFSLVDTLFGGKGIGQVKPEGRGFTNIETKIIEKITKLILKDLEEAWSEIKRLKMVFMRSEMDPQFASIVTSNDMVIVNKFSVDLESASGTITLCTPLSTLEPLKECLKTGFQGDHVEIDQRWRQYIQKKIGELRVNLNCTLGTSTIQGRKLLALKRGDVIELDQKVSDSIVLKIEGIPKFKGYPGACNNMKAMRVTKRMDKE
jgi:flagellar motor switch protein FliM